MNESININDYLCDPVIEKTNVVPVFICELSDEELFQTMDEIINGQYPDDSTYHVSDSDIEVPMKKQKKCIESVVFTPPLTNQLDNEEEIAMKKLEKSKTDEIDCRESRIRSKIDEVFRAMKLKEIVENC
jgi:hypothetical protein